MMSLISYALLDVMVSCYVDEYISPQLRASVLLLLELFIIYGSFSCSLLSLHDIIILMSLSILLRIVMLLNDVCFVLHVTHLYPFPLVVCINCTNQLYNKIGGQSNERLLLWLPSGIFLYLTVIILICFMLCWRIKYDDDDYMHILMRINYN